MSRETDKNMFNIYLVLLFTAVSLFCLVSLFILCALPSLQILTNYFLNDVFQGLIDGIVGPTMPDLTRKFNLTVEEYSRPLSAKGLI